MLTTRALGLRVRIRCVHGRAWRSNRKLRHRRADHIWRSGNEAEVGQGIKDSGVPRSDIFVGPWLSLFPEAHIAQ